MTTCHWGPKRNLPARRFPERNVYILATVKSIYFTWYLQFLVTAFLSSPCKHVVVCTGKSNVIGFLKIPIQECLKMSFLKKQQQLYRMSDPVSEFWLCYSLGWPHRIQGRQTGTILVLSIFSLSSVHRSTYQATIPEFNSIDLGWIYSLLLA